MTPILPPERHRQALAGFLYLGAGLGHQILYGFSHILWQELFGIAFTLMGVSYILRAIYSKSK